MVIKRKKNAVTGSTRSSVELLLAEDVPPLGQRGDLIRVKPGYARNYLVPQGLAAIATEENKRMVDLHKIKLTELQAERLKQLRQLAEVVSKYSVTLEANANPEGHLYGSIVAADISKALQTAGYAIKPEQVRLDGPLRELGMYTVKVQLHGDISTEVKVWVVPAAATVTS